MTTEEKEKIIKALNDRFVNLPCPRCGNQKFAIVEGYVNSPLQDNIGTITIGGGPALPSVVVGCTRCGFLSQHALGALGLLPDEKEKTDQEKSK